MVLSSEGLHLLSNVAVWRHDFETINDKNVALWHCYYTDVIRYYMTKENDCRLSNSNNNNSNKDYSTPYGYEVFRFEVSEEHHINQTFKTVNDFLEYWLKVYNRRQESSRLEPNVYEKISKETIRTKGQTGVQQEASDRYQKLSYTDKAIYRAIGKEYFRKKVVYVNN